MAEQQLAQTVRRWVMTGSVAAITAMGAWYGAGLKIEQDVKNVINTHGQRFLPITDVYLQEKRQRIEATPEQQIQRLEDRRLRLMRDRNGIQRKLDEITARQSNTQAPP